MNDEVEHRLSSAGLHLASLRRRAVAFLIDELLLASIFLIIIYDQVSATTEPEALVSLINSYTFEYLLIKVMYQTFFIYQYSATIGKIFMKIQVVDMQTFQKPIFASALNRAIFRVISEMLFYFGFIWAFYRKDRKSWHDLTARTLVVNV